MNIRWALLMLVVALPSYLIRFSMFGAPFTILESMIVLIFLAWLAKDWKNKLNHIKLAIGNKRKLKKINYPFSKEIILLLVVSVISVGVVGFSNNALGLLKAYFLEPIMLYIVVINVVRLNTKNIRTFGPESIILALATSAMLLSFFAIVQKYTGFGMPLDWVAEGRVTSVYSYPNALGLYLGPIVLLMIGLLFNRLKAKYQFSTKALSSKEDNKINIYKNSFLTIAILSSVMAIVFAKSEGAILGIIVGILIFGLLGNKKSRIITIIVIIVSVVGIFFWQAKDIRVQKKLLFKDVSSTIRIIGWKETIFMLKDKHWLWGTGLSGFQSAVKPYHVDGFFYNFDDDPDFRRKIVIFDDRYKSKYWQPLEIYMYPHNIFLNFWVELGLAGMIIFIWLIIKFLYFSIRFVNDPRFANNKYLISGLLSSMIVIVIHGMFDVPYFKNDLACLFWLIVALLSVIKLNYYSKDLSWKLK
ncbi:O-antigen ligase family protein [Patescibacteria group bacterium]|nr:O-antigen ligase family protein [Patescibacteria group bacterium]